MFDYFKAITGDAPVNNSITKISDLISIGINVLMGVGISISVIYIGLAGIRFINSKGDAKAMDQAKGALTSAVVAMLLTLGAVALKMILYGISGANMSVSGPVGDF